MSVVDIVPSGESLRSSRNSVQALLESRHCIPSTRFNIPILIGSQNFDSQFQCVWLYYLHHNTRARALRGLWCYEASPYEAQFAFAALMSMCAEELTNLEHTNILWIIQPVLRSEESTHNPARITRCVKVRHKPGHFVSVQPVRSAAHTFLQVASSA